MTTASTIFLPAGDNPESSAMASKLLQENHEQHHMFFNGEGFHNHINHGLLTLWALGASAAEIKTSYDLNKVFQRPGLPVDKTLSLKLVDSTVFLANMGDDTKYGAFLDFFTREITEKGWKNVLQKYLFAADERADSMLVRLFDSFLHPLIHVGFGIEFEQPAVIAEALAQTACHQDWVKTLLLPSEQNSRATVESRNVLELLHAIRADDEILAAPHWNDHDKIRDGIIHRAGDRMIYYISQVRVTPEDLSEKTAEMINACAYITAGAQRHNKKVKLDFYLLHSLTSATFFGSFLEQSWLNASQKARLVEWKIRMDLVLYASRKSPALDPDFIRNYCTKQPSDWNRIKERVCKVPDDGHAAKVIRALEQGRQMCEPYQSSDRYCLKDADWHQIALMTIDSVEFDGPHNHAEIQFDGPGAAWVRSAGFDEAWINVPALEA